MFCFGKLFSLQIFNLEENPQSDTMSRVCAACGYDLSSSEFSNNQWSKGVGISRCRECVSEGITCDSDSFGAARTNNATRVDVNVFDYDEEGSAKYCSYGYYTGGQRTGQRCVAKWYKDHEDHFDDDLYAVEKAKNIITQWNQALGDEFKIRINVPDRWTIDGRDCLVEPYIDGFFKMNSNTGWTSSDMSDEVLKLQALSHYSYHVSSGQFLLCDLQGGLYRDFIVLTDPVILSRRGNLGPMDLGPKGMSSFFHYHHCNYYCRNHWTQPRDQHDYYSARHQTTAHFGTNDDDDDDDDDDY